MSNLENFQASDELIKNDSGVNNISLFTRRSISEAIARDEELGYEYIGAATTLYSENSLL